MHYSPVSFGLLMQRPHQPVVADCPRRGDLSGLIERETQHAPMQVERSATGNQLRERRRCFRTADAIDGTPGRHLSHCSAHHIVQWCICRRLLIVVEHEHHIGGEPGEELPEVSSGKPLQIRKVLWHEPGQRRSLRLRVCVCGERQIVKQTSWICITGLDLVPQRRKAARFEVARHQRRLAGAWRTIDPDQRPAAVFVETREQPLPRHDSKQAWRADLGDRGVSCHLRAPCKRNDSAQ